MLTWRLGIPSSSSHALVGGLIGAWQGFWIAYVGIPAFIVTLAGMLTFRGLTQMVLQNVPITPFPDAYVEIGSGYLPDLGGGTTAFVDSPNDQRLSATAVTCSEDAFDISGKLL